MGVWGDMRVVVGHEDGESVTQLGLVGSYVGGVTRLVKICPVLSRAMVGSKVGMWSMGNEV